MSTADLVLAILGIWSFAGFAIVLHLPRPKTKLGAALQWIVAGPLGWAIGVLLIVFAIVDAEDRP